MSHQCHHQIHQHYTNTKAIVHQHHTDNVTLTPQSQVYITASWHHTSVSPSCNHHTHAIVTQTSCQSHANIIITSHQQHSNVTLESQQHNADTTPSQQPNTSITLSVTLQHQWHPHYSNIMSVSYWELQWNYKWVVYMCVCWIFSAFFPGSDKKTLSVCELDWTLENMREIREKMAMFQMSKYFLLMQFTEFSVLLRHHVGIKHSWVTG